eukprot:CAMPEP_0174383212 /NCGR_PEP_ID=MMETSP0811_2-20130205/125078_1 /TAXON_ID=73025 ORGANISM="Eutreptiella gymnastica-like, Strain CCMP1594" /NCGR_SAMPLE_ID=MMETSP0811_2 /ASSEMBLY_ACC=CAM_ASM_000667 /LENGTH=51 /DNA_ID=CAMNT_0015536711 /DNA_START=632 /DNA_END=787 /DNA_ORIENTATION=+
MTPQHFANDSGPGWLCTSCGSASKRLRTSAVLSKADEKQVAVTGQPTSFYH